jgi:hypothetical protein
MTTLFEVPWITQYMRYTPIDQRDASGSWARRPAACCAMHRFAPEAAGTTFPRRAGRLPKISRVTFDRVERETEAEPFDEPGQRITGQFVDVTPKVGFVGVVANARPFRDALLADPAVDAALLALERGAEVSCLALHKGCAFDHREA